MGTLHFICGKAGAGKTTLARELGRTLPGVSVVFDGTKRLAILRAGRHAAR